MWTTRGREAEHASLAVSGGVLLILTTNAELIVAKPAAAGFHEITRYDVADTPTWAHPALAGRQIVVKDENSLTSWTLPGAGATGGR